MQGLGRGHVVIFPQSLDALPRLILCGAQTLFQRLAVLVLLVIGTKDMREIDALLFSPNLPANVHRQLS
jgi:hypothetical protein